MRGRSVRDGLVTPAWVRADGPASDVALSTRARLARNIRGVPFPNRARDADLKRTADLVLDAVHHAGDSLGEFRVIRPAHVSEFDRLALVDARVASRQHVDGGSYRPVALNEAGTLSLMVNEEDHLRVQCILPGLQPLTALQMAQEFDASLASRIEYARTDNYGYLTASLANIGTGLRLSVMVHLAGLAMLGEALQALTAAVQLKISVRGLFGEGTKAYGDILQVSNETTIGFSEREITSRVRGAAEHLVSREREARRRLSAEKREKVMEETEQAWAHLMEARVLTGGEALESLSLLRLADALGLRPGISAKVFSDLLVSMRLGIAASDGRITQNYSSDVKRAGLLREKLTEDSRQ